MAKKAKKASKKDKAAEPRVKDLGSPKQQAKGVRGGGKMNDIIVSS